MDLETILRFIGTIIGAIIAGCIGIITARYAISRKEEITKKNTAKALSFEIKANQKRLQPLANLSEFLERGEHAFSWDSVPGDDDEKLKEFLRDVYNFDWAKNAEILKFDDGKTISIINDENSAKLIIDDKKEKATLEITDGGTFKLKVKKENGKRNIYGNKSNQILREISFERTIYSALSDKIGLLNIDNVVNYYTQIKLIEEEYNKLVQKFPRISDLRFQITNEKLQKRLGRANISPIAEVVDECFTSAKETYSTGDELIRDLQSIV
jgi:hypothetical protein